MQHMKKWMIGMLCFAPLAWSSKVDTHPQPQNTNEKKVQSEFCGAKLTLEDQKTLYEHTLDALAQVYTEIKAPESLKKIQELRKVRPHIIHIVGMTIKKSKARIHLSLCYHDYSKFLKCSDVFKELKAQQKLSEFYGSLLSTPLKARDVASFGPFTAITLDPKELMFEGKPVTSTLHISLLKIRENDDLRDKVQEKLIKKLESLPVFHVSKAHCRKRSERSLFRQKKKDTHEHDSLKELKSAA